MPHRSHYLVYLFLLGLAGAFSDVLQGEAQPTWLSALALAVFVVCFVTAVELAHRGIAAGEIAHDRPSRHDGPRAALIALMGVIAVATTLGFGSDWIVLFIYVVVTAAMLAPLNRAPVVVGVVAAVAIASEIAGGWNVISAATAASWALSIVMAGWIALLIRRRGVLINELRRTQSEVARLAAADAVSEERLRFARDLHDLLGHSLSLIVLKAELARRLLERGDSERARGEVADLEEAARRSLVEVREAVAGYRARSLQTELERGRAALAAAGVEMTMPNPAASQTLPPSADEILAWVIREAVTNIVRHSSARHVRIELTAGESDASLEVVDDGTDAEEWDWLAAARSGGSGLLGLQERVAAAGGRFSAGPLEGGGFRVRAVVPLSETTAPATAAPAAQTGAPAPQTSTPAPLNGAAAP